MIVVILMLQASLLNENSYIVNTYTNQFKTNKKMIEYSTKLVSTDIGASCNQNCGLAFN